MTQSVVLMRFTEALFQLFDETFEQVAGSYLDRGTSLFETLATISAEEASRPVSAHCASIAAQVEHVRYYMEVLLKYIQEQPVGEVNWHAAWRQTSVTPEEWAPRQQALRDTQQHVLSVLKNLETWEGEEEIGGAMAIVVHTVYHLGEIRQALCTIRN